MRTVTTAAPDGQEWRVRVAWLPRWRFMARRFGGWRRKRGRGGVDLGGGIDVPTGGGGGGGGDFFSSLADDIAVAIVVIIAFVVFAAVFWFLLLPLLLLVLDLLVVVVLCVAAAAGRVLFRRPWTVEAVADQRRFTMAVVGWRAALRTRDEMAEKLRLGYPEEAVVAAIG